MARTAVRKRKPRIEVYPKTGGLRLEFLKMEPRKQYALISAVRGPDSTDPNQWAIKSHLTVRIRAIVFIDDCPGNYDGTRLTQAELVSVKYSLDRVRIEGRPVVGAMHYLDHLRLAVKETQGHEIWNGQGSALLAMLTSAALSNHVGR
jgi:hypothetical protein